ncbi:MAG: dihydroorotate dehydrogenase electron transfer subunit [Candidatus Methanomethylophilaceae archaeon]|nr:dihydroorotate dehydrogenase electron transfer subunit [Candidatus Methanomethylophilaceae archaeon]
MSETTSRIEKIIDEAYDTKTFVFGWDAEIRPGQFAMVWVPGVDEIPMSISGINARTKSITVKAIGEATRKLHELKVGDAIRVRGPYGKGFDLSRGEMLIIGGGVGTAAVMPAIVQTGADAIIAARSEKDVIMDGLAERYSKNLRIATDDGSKGFHGNAVQLLKEMAKEKHYDCVLACGPEVMLHFTYEACKELGLGCQLSMERLMKCGAGACGCCVMDGMRVCKDGPVFDETQIPALTEFWRSKRDGCGRSVKLR